MPVLVNLQTGRIDIPQLISSLRREGRRLESCHPDNYVVNSYQKAVNRMIYKLFY